MTSRVRKPKRRTRDEVFISLDVRSERMLEQYRAARLLAFAAMVKHENHFDDICRRLMKRGYSLREIGDLLEVSHTHVKRWSGE